MKQKMYQPEKIFNFVRDAQFFNANGIASLSPGLPSPRGYPGYRAVGFPSTLKGLNQ
jgi:hypothetical protein